MQIFETRVQYIPVGECTESENFTSAGQVAKYLKGAFDNFLEQEQIWVVALDGANQPKGRYMVSLGLANQTQCHAREVFRTAIQMGAVSIIMAHNHPSGSLKPSDDDLGITKNIFECGNLLGIPLLDHIILASAGWKSIKSSNPETFCHKIMS